MFAPAREEAIASHEAYCVASPTAALLTPALIDAAFGTRAFRDVVSMHLAYHYQRLAAAKEVSECDSIADNIVAAWGAILLSELILFLVRARAGLYGSTYGRYTIESLGEQWARFQDWKRSAITRLRREARPRRKEETENYDYAALAEEHCNKIKRRIRTCRQ